MNNGIDVLRAYVAYEKERRERASEQARKLLTTTAVPLPDAVLQQLLELHAGDFAEVMHIHPGAAPERKIGAMWAVLRVFRTACNDLKLQIHSFAKCDIRNLDETRDVAAAVQKEIFTVSTAAAALVEHARRVRPLTSGDEYSSHLKAIFDPAEHEFIIELRNNLSHTGFIEASWQMKYRFDKPKESAFRFPKSELLAGDFNAEGRSFIDRTGETIDVEILFDSYGARVEAFYLWLGETIEANLPPEVADYRRCMGTHKRLTARAWYGVMLHHWIEWKIDPYAHLNEYLTPDDLDEIGRLPARTPQQVNRIIELADKEHICDDELRALVFRLFGVNQ